MTRIDFFAASLLATVSAAALAGVATAQTTSPAAPPPAANEVSGVTITAPREEVVARRREFIAPHLVNVQSAETIAKYPDFNAAEALGRIPGISLSSDTGEGRFVNIRGIDANLNGATYGGVVLLNTNPGGTAAGGGGRAVEFDTIPTGAIDGIVVTKTGLPDHEAEGLGGQVELTPRSAANITKPFVDATLGWGYEPLHDHSGPFDAELAVGARFGFDSKGLLVEGDGREEPVRAGFISNPTPFSFVLTGSRRDDRRPVDDLEENYLNDGVAPRNGISQYDLRRYDYHRRRFGYGGEFDFKPNENHSYYLRADVAGYIEAVHKNFLLFTHMADPTVSPSNPSVLVTTMQPQVTLTDEQETHRNQVYTAGGRDQFGDVVIDYHVAYSRATFLVGYNIGARFAGPVNVPLTYDNVSNADYPIFTFPSGINLNDPSQYNLSRLTNNQNVDVDEERTYAVNALFPLHLLNDSDRVKVGVQARIRDKVATEYDESYTLPALSLANASTAANTYYDGQFTNGPFINRYTIRALIAGGTPSSGPVFNPGSYFNAKENVYAGYLQYTTQVGKFGLLAGVRVEATNGRYGAYAFTTDALGNTSSALSNRSVDYTNAFPTVQVRYEFTPKFIGRLTYSTGIARPGFNQNNNASSVDLSQDPILISHGNPNLKPTTGNNFDFSLEYYLPRGGIIQFGLFDKEFDNYIVQRLQNGITTDPLSGGQLANVTTYLNIPSAYARGVEAGYHQQFTFLPGMLSGLGIEANGTIVDSRIEEYTPAQSATGLAEYGPLPGTSHVTWNVAGFYEAYGIQARLSAQYVSHSLFGLGGDRLYDTIQDDRTTLDLTTSYDVTRHFQVYFNAKNLLNTPLRYYEGTASLPYQREFYDVTIEGGVRARF